MDNRFRIMLHRHCLRSPARKEFLLTGLRDLTAKGWSNLTEHSLCRDSLRCVVAHGNGGIIGIIGYIPCILTEEIFVSLVYVDDGWRRQGVFRRMYQALKREADQMGCEVAFGVHCENRGMQAALGALAVEPHWIHFRSLPGLVPEGAVHERVLL